ncbi:MAG: histidine ammonia-lyase [Candidatus Hodarchaeota archaeon]
MDKPIVKLNGETLSVEEFVAIARDYKTVEITNMAQKKITRAAEIVQKLLQEQRKIYGVTTGFGFLQEVSISPEDVEKLQHNLIVSHSAGVGPEFPEEVVRGMILLQINKFARGHSGIRLLVVSLLMNMLNENITPIVPSQGSLGASGDLAPLAHLSLALIGKGFVNFKGKRMIGEEALRMAGLSPVRLKAKEGLALLNGTQTMTSLAALAIADSEYLAYIANLAVAMSIEVHQSNIDSLHPLIHQSRPHKGQIEAAKSIRSFLTGSKRIRHNTGLQDSYSIRCAPVVHGATLDTITYAKKVVEIEMNSSTDNPLIFSPDQIYSGGNFHGQPIAFAMDFLSIALAELGNISERRIERLLNPNLSGLPPFLTSNSGLNSGFMITQYSAASLVSENKQLAFPASIDSIPVSANQEDHVSMGTIAANKTRKIIGHINYILAIELLCAAQAIDLAQIHDQVSSRVLRIYQKIREAVPMLLEDRELAPDIDKCVKLIKDRVL